MPFNRAKRTWVYRTAKDADSTVAFGPIRDLHPAGTVFFVNCPFPTLGEYTVPTRAITIGPGSRQPYTTDSLLNVSGMSFGAISVLAIRALSKASAMANCWH